MGLGVHDPEEDKVLLNYLGFQKLEIARIERRVVVRKHVGRHKRDVAQPPFEQVKRGQLVVSQNQLQTTTTPK